MIITGIIPVKRILRNVAETIGLYTTKTEKSEKDQDIFQLRFDIDEKLLPGKKTVKPDTIYLYVASHVWHKPDKTLIPIDWNHPDIELVKVTAIIKQSNYCEIIVNGEITSSKIENLVGIIINENGKFVKSYKF